MFSTVQVLGLPGPTKTSNPAGGLPVSSASKDHRSLPGSRGADDVGASALVELVGGGLGALAVAVVVPLELVDGGSLQPTRPAKPTATIGARWTGLIGAWVQRSRLRYPRAVSYFSRLEIVPDPTAAKAAATLAREADVDPTSLTSLAEAVERLAARHAEAPFPREELRRLGQRYGSVLGEIVRARVGAAWGVGHLFTEVIQGGMLVGPREIKLWPWREIIERIEGRADRSLGERVDDLCAYAATADDDDDDPSRLYCFAPGEGYFDAGITRDGRQALMAAFYPATFAVFFDADGELLEYVERPNEHSTPDTDALRAWQRELGFEPQAIRVQQFELEDVGLGIEELPGHYIDFLEDPYAETDPEERAALLESIRIWLEEGSFVLYWGNDLWLDGSGHVTSS